MALAPGSLQDNVKNSARTTGTPGETAIAVVNPDGTAVGVTTPVAPIASIGRTKISLTRVEYSGGTITTSGYTTLIASTSDIINQMHIFSSTNKTMVLAVGAAASEIDQIYIPPGGFGSSMDLLIPAGSRVSIKAVDANPPNGVLLISYLK